MSEATILQQQAVKWSAPKGEDAWGSRPYYDNEILSMKPVTQFLIKGIYIDHLKQR